jgi:hypothetical protein
VVRVLYLIFKSPMDSMAEREAASVTESRTAREKVPV